MHSETCCRPCATEYVLVLVLILSRGCIDIVPLVQSLKLNLESFLENFIFVDILVSYIVSLRTRNFLLDIYNALRNYKNMNRFV